MTSQELTEARKKRIKWAYTTRNVDRAEAVQLLSGEIQPTAGDLVLARVTSLGQHKRLELISSRRADMFEGDEIIVAFGNRYAPDQFEGVVPDRLEPCHLVAAGGVAARMLNRHEKMKVATKITPLGMIADRQGNRLNLKSFALSRAVTIENRPLVLAVAGTAMNAGKTTACAMLVKGLVRRGYQVAAAKMTGTGAGADYRALVDAGADPVFDFVDAGYVSTYRVDDHDLLDIVMVLGGHMAAARPDVIVVEIADGLLQQETSRLFVTRPFVDWVDGVIFAANDALGAQAGVAWLEARQVPVIGVTGVLTSSPLARREAEASCGLPVYQTRALARTTVAAMVYSCLKSRRHQSERVLKVAAG